MSSFNMLDRSRSRSRSRSRDRKHTSSRKKGNWDKAPTSDGAIAAANAAAQIAAISAAAPNGVLAPGALAVLPIPGIAAPTARQARRIYVGNVQPWISEPMLRQFLNQVIASVPGRPQTIHHEAVNTITIKPEKMFAFVEFHNVDDAVSWDVMDYVMCMHVLSHVI